MPSELSAKPEKIARAYLDAIEARAYDLLDCLQLFDKAQIAIQDLGFETKGAAKRVVKELESLRNNLAHAQDIVGRDWPQIARMTQRIQALVLGACSGNHGERCTHKCLRLA